MLEKIDDPDLTALYAYWAGKCGQRAMPCRDDIDLSEIPSLLRHVFIVEIHRPIRLRFRFRLVGSAICARWGQDLTDRWLDKLDCDGERNTILRQYAAVAETGEPRFDIEEFVSEHGRYLHYRRLLLPLSDDGGMPNMLFGGQKSIGIDGYQVSVPNCM